MTDPQLFAFQTPRDPVLRERNSAVVCTYYPTKPIVLAPSDNPVVHRGVVYLPAEPCILHVEVQLIVPADGDYRLGLSVQADTAQEATFSPHLVALEALSTPALLRRSPGDSSIKTVSGTYEISSTGAPGYAGVCLKGFVAPPGQVPAGLAGVEYSVVSRRPLA